MSVAAPADSTIIRGAPAMPSTGLAAGNCVPGCRCSTTNRLPTGLSARLDRHCHHDGISVDRRPAARPPLRFIHDRHPAPTDDTHPVTPLVIRRAISHRQSGLARGPVSFAGVLPREPSEISRTNSRPKWQEGGSWALQ
jgi:hypothetical protein